MSFISIIAITLVVPAVVRILIGVLNRDKDRYGNKVAAPKACFFIGWTCYAMTAILFVVQLIMEVGMAIRIATVAAALIAVLFLTITYSLTIGYDKKGFTVRKFFVKKQYKYEDIDSVIIKSLNGYTLRINGRKTMVDEIMSGKTDFLYFADKQFTAHTGFSIPVEETRLFNGHIQNPYEILFALLLVPIFVTGVTIYIITDYNESEIPINLEPHELVVTSTRREPFKTWLETQDGSISLFDVPNKDDILNELSQGKALTMYIEPWRETRTETISTVWAVTDENGESIFTAEDTYEALMKYSRNMILLLVAIAIFVWIMFFFTCYIMSHADEHPILIKLIVRKDSLA